jgi:hypothetical protein
MTTLMLSLTRLFGRSDVEGHASSQTCRHRSRPSRRFTPGQDLVNRFEGLEVRRLLSGFDLGSSIISTDTGAEPGAPVTDPGLGQTEPLAQVDPNMNLDDHNADLVGI